MKSGITLTKHEKDEWKRYANALLCLGDIERSREAFAASEIAAGESITVSKFNQISSGYRAWLCFGFID